MKPPVISAPPERGAVISSRFFDRPADAVARELLGTTLVRRVGEETGAFLVAETEAYLGPHDLAFHSARGRTRRTEVMFGEPGTIDVYMIYGLHLMLNVVTGPERVGSAVLIRSAGNVTGPGRLGEALALSLDFNARLAAPSTGYGWNVLTMPCCGMSQPRGSASITPDRNGRSGSLVSFLNQSERRTLIMYRSTTILARG